MIELTKLEALLRLERDEQKAKIEALHKELSIQERAARGITLLDLEAVEESFGLGGRILVTLEYNDKSDIDGDFSVGDVVRIKPRKAETQDSVTGVISRRMRSKLIVAFDRPPLPFVYDGRLLIDVVANDVTFDRAQQAIDQIKQMEKGAQRTRRDIILGAATMSPTKEKEFTPQRPLNKEQEIAVSKSLQAEPFFLVHGPPGTGKSTVLGEIAVQLASQGKRLLGCAASNAAVDHLVSLFISRGLRVVRIGHPARVQESLHPYTLDLMVENHPDAKISRQLFEEAHDLFGYARKQKKQGRSQSRFQNARDANAEARKMLDDARALEKKAIRDVIDKAQVICATCTGLSSYEMMNERFDVALFDEATQCIEPLSYLPFLRAERVILAGDHKQLPPTVISQKAAREGLARSMFERLLEDHGDGVRQMLKEQYRMHQEIMDFPSREMYNGELRAHPSVAGRRLAEIIKDQSVDAPPVILLDTAGKGFYDEVAPNTESRQNPGEADLLLLHAKRLLDAGLNPNDLALIAPYSAQVALLQKEAIERGIPAEVEIDTVDSFQGREKEAILISLVRSNDDGALGFLLDLRRINVALTRAKRHLYVVGDSATFCSHDFYQHFLEYVQNINSYRSAWDQHSS
jgi:ATP-dependent RNA/DNA helicase IGHMBP2